MEENQDKPKILSLNDIKIEISLQEYFNMSYYRHNDDKITISEERFNLLSSQQGFNELIHVTKFEVEEKNIYRLQPLENYRRSIIGKDEKRVEVEAEIGIARARSKIIEDWKKEVRQRLMKTGKATKEIIESLILRSMNPETEKDRLWATKLNYPYREENPVKINIGPDGLVICKQEEEKES